MEPLPQEPTQNSWDTVSAKSSKKTPITIAGIVLLVLLLAGGVYLYRSGYSIDIGPLHLGPQPQHSVPQENIPFEAGLPKGGALAMDCSIKKEENPLIRKIVDVMPKLRQIDFQGHVATVTNGEANKTINLSLTSVDGSQTVGFTFDPSETVNFGTSELKITELKMGDEIIISYNCSPEKTKDPLRLSRIRKIQD